jgi:hypothetical protein
VRPCFCAGCGRSCAIVIPAAVVNSSSIDNPAPNSIQDSEKRDPKKKDERENTGRAQEAQGSFSSIAAHA